MTTPPLRTHGQPPYHITVIHGGPGALGDLQTVAATIAQTHGVIEPLLTACSIEGQLQELHNHLQTHATSPYTLIGHSWGAWLAMLYTARRPDLVSRLILVSSGPLDDHYAATVAKTRLKRLSAEDRQHLAILQSHLDSADPSQQNSVFKDIGHLLFPIDSTDPLHYNDSTTDYRYDVFTSVWTEAEHWRKTGRLLQEAQHITCPVIAIHGEDDPHPAAGVSKPLTKILPDFQFILLQNCGHYPWLERQAHQAFYDALKKVLA